MRILITVVALLMLLLACKSKHADSFAKIKDFKTDFYSPNFDSIITAMRADKRLQVKQRKEYETETLIISDSVNKTELITVNSPMDKQEFFLQDGQLQRTHIFSVMNHLDDNGYIMEEKIYDFATPNVIVKTRKKDIAGPYIHQNLNDVPYIVYFGKEALQKNLETDLAEEHKDALKGKKVLTTVAATGDPFEKIKKFDMDFLSPDFQQTIKGLRLNKSLLVNENPHAGGGDVDRNLLLLRDTLHKSELLISTSDIYEHGTSGRQYFSVNNTLKNIHDVKFLDREEGKGFVVIEKIYDLSGNEAVIKRRKKNIFPISRNYNMNDVPYKTYPVKDELLSDVMEFYRVAVSGIKEGPKEE